MFIFLWHTSCTYAKMKLTKEEKELVENNKKYIPLLEKYTNTASPYPTVEGFCLINNIDIKDLKHWCLLDEELKEKVRRIYLKAYTILEQYMIVDVSHIVVGNDSKKYKLDKKGLMLKLKELKEILEGS